MKWKFFIVHMDGRVTGTNEQSTADNYSTLDDYFVIDAENQTTLVDGTETAIEEEIPL